MLMWFAEKVSPNFSFVVELENEIFKWKMIFFIVKLVKTSRLTFSQIDEHDGRRTMKQRFKLV